MCTGTGPRASTYALLGEFILRIEVQRGSELRQRLHLPAIEQVAVSAFQMHPGQMLPRHFPRGQVLHILRDQARGFLKFVKGFVETLEFVVLRFLEFEAARKGLAGGLQVLRGTVGRQARPRSWSTAMARAAGGVSAAKHTPASNNTIPAGSHRILLL